MDKETREYLSGMAWSIFIGIVIGIMLIIIVSTRCNTLESMINDLRLEQAAKYYENILKDEPVKIPAIEIKITLVDESKPEKVVVEEEIVVSPNQKDMEMIAQLVEAEAGNQDLDGKRYVVDAVLNRVDSEQFPDTVEEVIYQEDQFSVVKSGSFDKAKDIISEESREAVKMEYTQRRNYDILYFSRGKSPYASHHFKHQDHWFGW